MTTTSQSEFEKNNVFVSIKRTLIPVLVGALLSVFTTWGFDLDPDAVASVLTGIYSGVYYVAARWLERKFPSIGGFLLGDSTEPTYLKAPTDEA